MTPKEARNHIQPGDEVELTWLNEYGVRLSALKTAKHAVIGGMGGWEFHAKGESAVIYLGDGSSKDRPEVRGVIGKVSS